MKTRSEAGEAVVVFYEQKRVDVALTVDLLTLADTGKITDAILVSGDSDLLEPVSRAKLLYGVKVTLWHHPDICSNELWNIADQRRLIGEELVTRKNRSSRGFEILS